MPQITATPATVYLHCRNARCPAPTSRSFEGVREETAYTFGENGGDGIFVSFIERSTVEYRVEDEALPCPVCSRP
jgi:hypothetical protein